MSNLAHWGFPQPPKKPSRGPVQKRVARNSESASRIDFETALQRARHQKERAEYHKEAGNRYRQSFIHYKKRNNRLEAENKHLRRSEEIALDMWLEGRVIASTLKPEAQGDKFLVDGDALRELFKFMGI